MQQLFVDAFDRELDVPDDAAADEAVFDREEVGVELAVGDGNVVELDVEVLVYGVDTACDAHVILEFHRDRLVRQRLEEAVEKHRGVEETDAAGGLVGWTSLRRTDR